MVKSVTVHGKCSAISDGDWQVFPSFYCPKELVTARGKNESEGWLLTNLVISDVHCLPLFFFLDNLDCALGVSYRQSWQIS